MASLVTLAGIDEAIAHLALREDTLKYRLLMAVRSHFPTEESLAAIDSIPPEELIRQVWETGDSGEIQQKRKNLSGLKSSLNKSLRELSRKGLNPEGIILGRENAFIVSEEKKNSLIEQLGLGAESALTVKEAFSSFQSLFSTLIQEKGIEAVQELLAGLEQTKAYLEQAAKERGLAPGTGPDAGPPVFPTGGENTAFPEWPADAAGGGDSLPAGHPGLPGPDIGEAEIIEAEEVEIVGETGEEAPPAGSPAPLLEEIAEEAVEELSADEAIEIDGVPEETSGADGGLQPEAAPAGAGEAVIEAEQVFFEDEIEEAELAGDDPEPEAILAAAPGVGAGGSAGFGTGALVGGQVSVDGTEEAEVPEEASDSAHRSGDGQLTEETVGPEMGETAAAVEEVEAGEILYEDEIEEAELPEEAAAALAAPGPERPDAAASPETEEQGMVGENLQSPEGAAGGEVIEAEDIFSEDEVEQVELAEGPEEAPSATPVEPLGAAGLQDAGSTPPGEAAPAAGNEPVIETEAVFFEDEIEELEEVLGEESSMAPEQASDSGEMAAGDLLEEEEIEQVELLPDEELALDAGEDPAGHDPAAGPEDTMGLLEALSGLVGEQEAGTGGTGAANDPYLAQILSRFAPRYHSIPAGAYRVGSPEPQGRELPRREVRLPSFRIGQFPVTNDLFELFVRETGYVTEAEKRGYGLVYEGRFANHTEPATGRAVFSIDRGTSMRQADGADWRHPAGPESTIQGKHRHPVVQVTLADALAFVRWAGKRLPSEEEWEAAAGAHDGRPFPWGHDWSPARANVLASLWGGTTPVDEHGPEAASPFGVADLLGNVYEWTATIHGSKGGGRGLVYVLKGGSWATGGRVTIAHRTIEKESHCSNIVGFRCAADF
ncbi:MAG: SUMF1/EgtB/PvdO family nonheme iron enzyme [Desulfobacteraceae bacterium]|nr:SUMF1/EgtB/PvdO family nonheme iron enzyme [Desulfobacteraceae bacterium]